MRRVLLTALVIGAGAIGAQAAPAMAMEPAGTGSVILIDGGCGGPEFFRAPNGVCYRKRAEYRREGEGYGYDRPPPGPPPGYYRPEGCQPGTHPTPYGCRPNY